MRSKASCLVSGGVRPLSLWRIRTTDCGSTAFTGRGCLVDKPMVDGATIASFGSPSLLLPLLVQLYGTVDDTVMQLRLQISCSQMRQRHLADASCFKTPSAG